MLPGEPLVGRSIMLGKYGAGLLFRLVLTVLVLILVARIAG